MPQINVFTFLSQTSWTILIFILYYINMKQILIPSLIEMIKLKKNSTVSITNNNNNNINNYLNI